MATDGVSQQIQSGDVCHHLEREGVLLLVTVELLEHGVTFLVTNGVPLIHRLFQENDILSILQSRLDIRKKGSLARTDVAFDGDNAVGQI